MANTLKTYYEEKAHWDKLTTRYDENADVIATYRYPCEELTFPYTALIWIMVDFYKEYYLKDVEGFEAPRFSSASRAFWKRAKQSPMYQYEKRNSTSLRQTPKSICRNLINIYKEIEEKGYNLAKPVPIAENFMGDMVTLKGAKRIAVLLAFGEKWISVKETDRNTLENIKDEEQKEMLCRNHTRTIFNSMGDMPYVKELMSIYDQHAQSEEILTFKATLDHLISLVEELDRQEGAAILKTIDNYLKPLINSMDIMNPQKCGIVIKSEVEIIEYLYRRRMDIMYIIINDSQVDRLQKDYAGSPLQISKARSKEDIISIAKSTGISEIWIEAGLKEQLAIEEGELLKVKTFNYK